MALEPLLPGEAIRALALDGAGRVWLGGLRDGIHVWDGTRLLAVEQERLGNVFVRDLAWSGKGEMLAATERGAFVLRGETIWRAAEGDFLRVFPDVAGHSWISPMRIFAQEPGRPLLWDGQELRAVEGAGQEILGVVSPGPGRTWIASSGGIFEGLEARRPLELQSTPLWRPEPRGRDEESESRRLPPVCLRAAFQAAGHIWFVHPSALIEWDGERFAERLVVPRHELSAWHAEDAGGTIGVVGYSGRLYLFGHTPASAASSPWPALELPLRAGESIAGLAAAGEGFWVATEARRVARLFRVKGGAVAGSLELDPRKSPISANEMLVDRQGTLWLASDDGLYRFAEE